MNGLIHCWIPNLHRVLEGGATVEGGAWLEEVGY
jgi:hypothetical protein